MTIFYLFCFALVHWFVMGHNPPDKVPADLKEAFSMNGRIPIEDYYVDDSEGGKGTHYKFGATYINKLIETSIPEQVKFLGSRRFLPSEDEEFDEEDRVRWQERLDLLLVTMLHKNYWPLVSMLQHPHLFEDKNVAVFGSMDPYFECVALFLGAKKVTTFEYNQLTFDTDGDDIEVVTGDEYSALLHAAKMGSDEDSVYKEHFDVVISFSSFDHSGLGRYGDKISPDADIEAMRFARTVTRPGGRLFLTLPIGPDVCVWNLHRRYGAVRLPLMLAAFFGKEETCSNGGDGGSSVLAPFDVVGLGWSEAKLREQAPFTQTYEPVLILTK